ncbi:hypothetical protein R6Q59_033020 [Mikania micrantha]
MYANQESSEYTINACIRWRLVGRPPDMWVWTDGEGNDSNFCKRHIRRRIDNFFAESGTQAFTWNRWIPIKANVFNWRANIGRLPTLEALSKRGINIPSLCCPMCNDLPKTHEHLFTSCFFALM